MFVCFSRTPYRVKVTMLLPISSYSKGSDHNTAGTGQERTTIPRRHCACRTVTGRPGINVRPCGVTPSERHAELRRRGGRARPAGRDAGVAGGLALPRSDPGARGGRVQRWGRAVLGESGAARASAQPVGRGGRGLGASPSAALPAPHAVGQAHW